VSSAHHLTAAENDLTAPSSGRDGIVLKEVTITYARAAVERAMKVQEVNLREFSGRQSW
jgi:hypothetical protein